MVVYYVSFGQPFDANLTCAIAKSGALPVIQIDPDHTSVAEIGAGFYDTYIANYAEAVKRFHATVVISFAHEMNGNWYPWGPPKTSPSSVVAAWRQIHDVFDATGATNVIWLWTPNILYSVSPPLSDYYPGNSYVNWVGIDGYFRLPGETFQSVFGATLQQVTELTSKPILIAETGVADVPGSGLEVDSLFSGVESRQMLGLVWFNSRGSLDWRLEDDPRALAAFRTQARTGW